MKKVVVTAAAMMLVFLAAGCTSGKPAPDPTDTDNPPVQSEPVSQDPGQEPGETQSAIKWYPQGIGLPLVSDDPAAAGKKVVMLTFDDGPSDKGTTAKILDILKEENVKAGFFITGEAFHHRELVERVHREGHLLGPHAYTHANLSELAMAEQREEIEPLLEFIQEITGEAPGYLRPPFGAYNDDLLALAPEYGLTILTWSDGSLDWEVDANGYKNPAKVVETVMEQLHPGAVILCHDTLQHTADALPDLIRSIRAEGYEFVLPQ